MTPVTLADAKDYTQCAFTSKAADLHVTITIVHVYIHTYYKFATNMYVHAAA